MRGSLKHQIPSQLTCIGRNKKGEKKKGTHLWPTRPCRASSLPAWITVAGESHWRRKKNEEGLKTMIYVIFWDFVVVKSLPWDLTVNFAFHFPADCVATSFNKVGPTLKLTSVCLYLTAGLNLSHFDLQCTVLPPSI